MGIGFNIAEKRHAEKMTQEQLAELSGLTTNHLSKIEREVITNIGIDHLSKISKALNVSIDDLIDSKTHQHSQHVNVNQRLLNQYLDYLPNEKSEKIAKKFLEILKLSSNG